MQTKVCSTCGIPKPVDLFYKAPGYALGVAHRCKRCTRESADASRKKRLANPEKRVIHNARRRLDYPEKYAARIALPKTNVRPGYQRHHWSYRTEHWLSVIYVTPEQHALVHKHTLYDKESMLYKTCAGLLLATAEEYCAYIAASTGLVLTVVDLSNQVRDTSACRYT
jgi:hypothetical protein